MAASQLDGNHGITSVLWTVSASERARSTMRIGEVERVAAWANWRGCGWALLFKVAPLPSVEQAPNALLHRR